MVGIPVFQIQEQGWEVSEMRRLQLHLEMNGLMKKVRETDRFTSWDRTIAPG